jgi:hypothetical protein
MAGVYGTATGFAATYLPVQDPPPRFLRDAIPQVMASRISAELKLIDVY